MNRRQFFITGAALAVSAAFLKPNDLGSPYNEYFTHLNNNLKSSKHYLPSMLVDLDKLDLNITALSNSLNKNVDLRIVAKSLPSPDLLGYIMEKSGTNKLMVFHQPFLNQITNDYPNSDILMGKPIPVQSAANFYELLDDTSDFDSTSQLQWLIDSQVRLEQYLKLARKLNTLLQVNIEIDVGLHRGGLQTIEELDPLLTLIANNPNHLKFSGFMGYDPHVVKLPSIIKSAEDAYLESQEIYQSFIDRLYQFDEHYTQQTLCFNGAGSPTIAMHKNHTVANELSAGSCLVKPTDFDLETLANFIPASYIATPVLKKMLGTNIPAIEFAKDLLPLWDPNMQQTFFIYGGKWSAKYESPKGLQSNGLFGSSTNQEIVNASKKVNLQVDDFIFFRPTQSEFVFLQFGNLLALRKQNVIAQWPILKNT
ncbi:alanine racemase [Thalassotalea profundi]|uniref:Alanine racemase N-terminal domain-containing protein n=1 Tax=Thalassotalea profundi TaxID=2036687 RepID=A0ABQ3IQC1_9GAMM|nr:alanine racemase [Thalassotalea profundi]GHE91278.1 hypothetical protein GCM10011501_20990 [Thalassotalea profundi]